MVYISELPKPSSVSSGRASSPEPNTHEASAVVCDGNDELDLITRRLMSHLLRSGDKFASLTYTDAREMAVALIAYRNGRIAGV